MNRNIVIAPWALAVSALVHTAIVSGVVEFNGKGPPADKAGEVSSIPLRMVSAEESAAAPKPATAPPPTPKKIFPKKELPITAPEIPLPAPEEQREQEPERPEEAERPVEQSPVTGPVEEKRAPEPAPDYARIEAEKAAAEARSGDERRVYMARMASYIDKNKLYPESARRRGLQGKVRVCFMLMADGTICELRTECADKALCRAAEDTVTKAAPFQPPPASMTCPKEVAFYMEFSLR